MIRCLLAGIAAILSGFGLPESQRIEIRVATGQQQPKAPAPNAETQEDRAITGLILDDQGQPVEGAQVIIDRIGKRDQFQMIGAGENGGFKTQKLAPGLYAMEVHWPGYVLAPGSSVSGFHRPGDHLTIHLIKGGVISGRVTQATGEPIVAASIRAYRIRDLEGRNLRPEYVPQQTDDRGVYRLYGLRPGYYVIGVQVDAGVYAGGSEAVEYAPVFYPSSSRASAGELKVQAGEEISGIDIQLRRERGHTITGVVSGSSGTGSHEGEVVKLLNARSGDIEKTANVSQEGRFALFGIPDGEYDLYAQKVYGQGENAGSAVRRIVLRGADVIGADLKLTGYGSISGRVTIDRLNTNAPAARCENPARHHLEEILPYAKNATPAGQGLNRFFESEEYWGSWRGSAVNEKGEFTIRNLESGRYHLDVGLPGDAWYVHSIIQPAAIGPGKTVAGPPTGIPVKSAEKVSGVEVRIAEGAAALRGRVVPVVEAPPGSRQPPARRFEVHLITAAESDATNLLRYAETMVGTDGSYEFKNLAPGKYWLLARPARVANPTEAVRSHPVAWDEGERLKLHRDAKAANIEVELKPCQRLEGQELKLN